MTSPSEITPGHAAPETAAAGVVHYRPEHRAVACGAQVRDPGRLTADPEQVTCGRCTQTDAHNGALNAQFNSRAHEEYYKPGGAAEQSGLADPPGPARGQGRHDPHRDPRA